jgi:hypothetical protein
LRIKKEKGARQLQKARKKKLLLLLEARRKLARPSLAKKNY